MGGPKALDASRIAPRDVEARVLSSRFTTVVAEGEFVVLEARELRLLCVVAVEADRLVLVQVVVGGRSFVREDGHHELARAEQSEHLRDELHVGSLRRVRLERHVGELQFRCHMDGDVVAGAEKAVHGVSARTEQKVVHLHAGKQPINARLLGGFSGRRAASLREDGHYFVVQIDHDQLECLIAKSHSFLWVQSVQIPAISVDLAETVGGANLEL